jgi:glycosyltransferase involved in cell wall biosynthesis
METQTVTTSSEVLLSIVSPVYRAESTVTELVRRIDEAAAKITDQYEIVLVEDRCPDGSWQKIVEAARSNPRVRGARLSRNFGQHAAITAALSLSRGNHVVVLDCDLQHDPAEIPKLYAKAMEGHDVVLVRHPERQHAPLRNFGASAFRWFNTLFSGNEQVDTDLSGFSILSRKVVDVFLLLPESQRHYLHIVTWLGFSAGYVDAQHHQRHAGSSSYTTRALIRHALHGTIGQSKRLLHLSIGLGFAYFAAATLGTACIVMRYILWGLKEGWASGIVLLLASTGCILLTLGIVGLYIGSIFEQVRGRPLFIIDETTDSILSTTLRL